MSLEADQYVIDQKIQIGKQRKEKQQLKFIPVRKTKEQLINK